MIGVAISIWQAIVGGGVSAALGDDSGSGPPPEDHIPTYHILGF